MCCICCDTLKNGGFLVMPFESRIQSSFTFSKTSSVLETLLRISCGISSMKMIATGAFRSCEMTWRSITCFLINLCIWIAFHSQWSFKLSLRALTNERQDFLAVLGLRWKQAALHVACNMWCLYWKIPFSQDLYRVWDFVPNWYLHECTYFLKSWVLWELDIVVDILSSSGLVQSKWFARLQVLLMPATVLSALMKSHHE